MSRPILEDISYLLFLPDNYGLLTNRHLAKLSNEERNHFSESASQLLYTPASQLTPANRRQVETIVEPKFTTFLPDLKPYQNLIDQLWQHRSRLNGAPELLTTLLVAAPVCWPEQCRRASRGNEKLSHDKMLWMLLLSQLYRFVFCIYLELGDI